MDDAGGVQVDDSQGRLDCLGREGVRLEFVGYLLWGWQFGDCYIVLVLGSGLGWIRLLLGLTRSMAPSQSVHQCS